MWKKVAPQGTITYQYDENGNVTRISTSHGASVGYGLDSLNRLSTVTNNAGGTPLLTTYHYDDAGNLTNFAYPNGITTTYHYNSLNRLTDMAVVKSAGGTPEPRATFDYNPSGRELGAAGNRRAVRETIGGVSRSVNYDYDSLYRLTVETIVSGTPNGSIVYDNSTGYVGYDKVGNRRSRKVSTTALQNAGVSDFNNATFGVNDWLDSSSYDPNGNTTVEDLPAPAISPTTGKPDEYDFENRLTKRWDGSTTIQIVYDGDGHRVRKTVGSSATHYLVDDRNPSGYAQVLEELTSAGTTPAKVYAYGLRLISQRLAGGTVNYYAHDGHGSARFLIGADGTIQNTYTYDAFGILIGQTGSTPNNYLYSAEQFDFDLGEYYLRARSYNPNTGRFWTMDSFEGNREDPLSLHKYLYCQGEPVDNVDPSGKDLTDDLLKGGQAALKATASALKAIARGGTAAGAASAALLSAGPGLFTSILHSKFSDALIPWGRRLEVELVYKRARIGAEGPRGAMSLAALGPPSLLVVDFNVDQSDVKHGLAPVSIVFEVDGSKQFLLCYIEWRDWPDGKTVLTLYPSMWNGLKMVPDFAHPVGIGGRDRWFGRSITPVYHILVENSAYGR